MVLRQYKRCFPVITLFFSKIIVMIRSGLTIILLCLGLAVFAQQEENSKQREEDYKQQLEAGKAYIEHIKEEAARQAHVADLEQQRTSMMLELVNKEKDMMQQSYARDYAELTRLREQYNQLSTENAQHCEELRLIHASRGFKLLNMGYPIKKRIWKIFGKEI